MRVTLPLTGTIKELKEGKEQFVVGDDKDPIRPMGLSQFGDCSWKMAELDIKNQTMTIDITPSDKLTEKENTDLVANVKSLETHTVESLAILTGDKPVKVAVEKAEDI